MTIKEYRIRFVDSLYFVPQCVEGASQNLRFAEAKAGASNKIQQDLCGDEVVTDVVEKSRWVL